MSLQQRKQVFIFVLGNTNVNNFAYQVQVTIVQGSSAGVVFRADNNGDFYYFRIGIDQSYELDVVAVSGNVSTLTSTSSGNR